MPKPVSVANQYVEVISRLRLRPGVAVTLRVLESLPGRRYKLLWNGKTIFAESRVPLRAGGIIHGQVEGSLNRPRIRLLPSSSETSGAALNRNSMSPLAAALIREGLALPDDAEMTRLSSLLARTKGRRLLMGRICALLLSRGADPSADFLEYIDAVLSGRHPDENKDGQRREWTHLPNPEEVAADLKTEKNDPLVELLNAAAAPERPWFFAVRRWRLGGRNMNLTWKFRPGREPALAFTIHDNERSFEFLIEGRSPIRITAFADCVESVSPETWEGFRQRMALMNVRINDILLPILESDGFTARASEAHRNLEVHG